MASRVSFAPPSELVDIHEFDRVSLESEEVYRNSAALAGAAGGGGGGGGGGAKETRDAIFTQGGGGRG
jgi:hypothetical protein